MAADSAAEGPKTARLGEILVERGLITTEQLATALTDQETSGELLGAILIARGFVAPTTIAAALATQYGGLLKTEYGFANGFGPAPESTAPVAKPAPGEASPLRLSPQLVADPAPPAAQLEAVPVQAPAPPPAQPEPFLVQAATPPAEDPRLAELTSEREELARELAGASAEIDRLAAENASLAAQFAGDRDTWGAEIDRLAAENRSAAAQLAELTTERDAARAAPATGNDDLAARLTEIEIVLARVTNRGSTISERLDEVIGDVARLHERLGTQETEPAPQPPAMFERPSSDPVWEPDAA